jgi:hypothetical protein
MTGNDLEDTFLDQLSDSLASSARDSKRFALSVNVEPQRKIDFKLTYEEVLSRQLGTYKHVINLDPGQIVNDLKVTTRINESCNITMLRVPALRTSNDILEQPSGERSKCVVRLYALGIRTCGN